MEKTISEQDTRIEHPTHEIETAHPLEDASSSKLEVGKRMQALLKEMRPRQWTKNLAVFIGLVFAGHLFQASSFTRTALAFVAFCLASSTIYLINDLLDLEKDRQHPVKRLRPLASGKLPISWAIGALVGLVLCTGIVTAIIFIIPIGSKPDIFAAFGGANLLFTLTIVAYLVLMVLYSIRLKHIVLLDVFIIASGFVLRIIAGAVVVPVSISPWLYIVTCFLSLFLAFSKRRHELVLLQGQASQHRQILKEYSIPMLDQMITIAVTGTIMSYSLYTIEGSVSHHHLIAITLPLVLYGMFRYLYLVYMRMEGGSPEEVLLRDRHILGTVILCVVLIMIVLYALPQ
ncbi:MAG TPA: decaprenyl-phosphate phosphoribosyltransferase [Ktedonobacteraceae bacterium]